MSCETFKPLARLEIVDAFGRGFLAALIFPSGVEDEVMVAVAPEVDKDRGEGRDISNDAVGEGLGLTPGAPAGSKGEVAGDSKGPSESKPSLGVDAAEAMVHCSGREIRLEVEWSTEQRGFQRRRV